MKCSCQLTMYSYKLEQGVTKACKIQIICLEHEHNNYNANKRFTPLPSLLITLILEKPFRKLITFRTRTN